MINISKFHKGQYFRFNLSASAGLSMTKSLIINSDNTNYLHLFGRF